MIYFSDARPCETIWFIGDGFLAGTYSKGYQQTEQNEQFLREHFGVLAFHNDQHLDTNLISRIRNVLVSALNKHSKLPKLVVIVLDNDMIKFVDHEKYGASIALGKIMDVVVESLDSVIKTRKDQIAKNAYRDQEPHFIWMGAPIHQDFNDNSLRVKFNTCMESIIKQFKNMSFLMPRKGWEIDNHKIVKNESFTVDGSKMYWKAVECAIKFWMAKNIGQIVQTGPKLGVLESTDVNASMNVAGLFENKVKSKVVKVGKFAKIINKMGNIAGLNRQREIFSRKRRINVFNQENAPTARPKFDRFHWYKNAWDMERGHGELRRKILTPGKKIKRKLNF